MHALLRPRHSLALLVVSSLLSACGDSTGSSDNSASDSSDPQELRMSDDPIAELRQFIADKGIDIPGGKTSRTALPKPPKLGFPSDKTYTWVLETNKGTIDVRLMPDVAPMHCSSTVYLTEAGFYDDIIFHRVIPGFMAQGGCPRGEGTGSPGYSYDGEFSDDVRHDKPGLLSMANRGPGTDGSQFFLTFVPTPHLDGKHTIFGEVSGGMDVVKALEKAGHPSRSGATLENLKIEKATIRVD